MNEVKEWMRVFADELCDGVEPETTDCAELLAKHYAAHAPAESKPTKLEVPIQPGEFSKKPMFAPESVGEARPVYRYDCIACPHSTTDFVAAKRHQLAHEAKDQDRSMRIVEVGEVPPRKKPLSEDVQRQVNEAVDRAQGWGEVGEAPVAQINVKEMPINRACGKCGWTHAVGSDCPARDAVFVTSHPATANAREDMTLSEAKQRYPEAPAPAQSLYEVPPQNVEVIETNLADYARRYFDLFEQYRHAWLREMGGVIRPKRWEIDGFVLRQRDIYEKAKLVDRMKRVMLKSLKQKRTAEEMFDDVFKMLAENGHDKIPTN